MRTSEVLDKAADEIQRRGWMSADDEEFNDSDPWGEGAGSDSKVCLEGGIMAAMGTSLPPVPWLDWKNVKDSGVQERHAAIQKERSAILAELHACPAYAAVREYLGYSEAHHLYTFNDTEGREAHEVIEVLRATAAIERVKEAAEVLA